jgi:ribosomal protein S18 acetylase RimI-like enzyme
MMVATTATGIYIMRMQLFRRNPDLSQAHVRTATDADLSAIGRLLRDSGHRYYGLSGKDLPRLLAAVPAVVLEARAELLGVAMPGWRARRVTWLRGVVLARGVGVASGVEHLLPPLHHELRAQGVQHIFYAGDESSDTWLAAPLARVGYVVDTTVVVFEKHTLHIPSEGNQEIVVRRASSSDLTTLVELDRLCFEAHWTKSESSMSAALLEDSFFVVAEDAGQVVGYAYATSHFHGRLVHLVRLAVNPRYQRRGIGARLMAELVMFARTRGADLVTLNTQTYNERAKQLYRYFGFAPNGESQTILRYDL